MTSDAARKKRAIGQILLLAAGFLVLVAISATSVILVNRAREDSGAVIHTVEVQKQISNLLLELRRAESAARGYLLTAVPQFQTDHEAATATVIPNLDKLTSLTADNPVQIENIKLLRQAIISRLAQFEQEMDFVKRNTPEKAVALVREVAANNTGNVIRDVANAMQSEEDRLFAQRTISADRSQLLASLVTIAGRSKSVV